MLGFFKVNDPYRLLVVLLLLVLVRGLFFWFGVPLTIPEVKWLTIGEKLAEGGVMYRDVWDNTPPLAAFVYHGLFMLFGKTHVPYRVLSIALVIYQAGIFNNMLLKNKAYNQNTYVPALVYMLFMNMSFDFFTLSPILMSMTFVLLAINSLFKRMDNQTRDELFVQIGVNLGIATLFYPPSTLYFIVAILSLLIYTGSILRRMLLSIYGYTLVIILACTYYFWNDSLELFRIQFLESFFNLGVTNYLSLNELLMLSAIPFLIFLVSFYKTNKQGRFVNFQMKIQRVMVFFFVSGILAMGMVRDFTTFQLIYFVPAVAFFVTHYILTIRSWAVSELTFLFIVILVLCNNLFPLKNYIYINQIVTFENLIVKENKFANLIKDKKVLLISKSPEGYVDAKLATPYLNWEYSLDHLAKPGYYDKLTALYNNFSEDMPEVIIDEMNLVPKLFDKMPTIESQYQQKESFVYLLKN